MYLVSPSSDIYTYNIVTSVVGGASTSLIANMGGPQPSYVWAEVKNEGYYVTSRNQLPSNAVNFEITKFTTLAGTQDVHTLPWKQGFQCEGLSTCPSSPLSSSCSGYASQSQDSISIGFQ